MSKITDEAKRIVKMTNDSRYMGYSFVSEAQQQAVNVLNLNKELEQNQELINRLSVLAIKHCPIEHRDFKELKKITILECENEATNQLS